MIQTQAQQVQDKSIFSCNENTRIDNSSQSEADWTLSGELRQSGEYEINCRQESHKPQGCFLDLQLRQINKTLREQSLAYFLPIYEQCFKLATLIQRWDLYQYQFKQEVLLFLNLIYLKAAIFGNVFYSIFEGIEELTQELKVKLKIDYSLRQKLEQYNYSCSYSGQISRNSVQKKNNGLITGLIEAFQIKVQPLDKIFQQIMQESLRGRKWEGDQLVQKLFWQMSHKKQFQQQQTYWISIFDKCYIYNRIDSKVSQKSFLANIQNQKMMNISCLGCMRFAYEGFRITNATNLTPAAIFPSIHKLRQVQTQVKEKISAFMNTGGGVILFNCAKEFFNIKIQGTRISEKQKEAYEQIIISFLPSFHPRLALNQNIVISFVPIVSLAEEQYKDLQLTSYKGEEGLVKQGQTYYKREYIQGFYICRIKICPFKDRRPCLWLQNQGDFQTSRLSLNPNTNSEEPIKNLRKILKRNIAQNQPHQEFFQLSQNIIKPYTYFDHQCLNPEPGIIISNSSRNVENEQSRKKESLENSFKYMSLIIVKSKYLQVVKQKLRKYGGNVFIDRPFTSYKFKPAVHAAVMYHNIKFETILKEVCFSRQFQFQGKSVLAINVTPFLKLNNRKENNLFSHSQFQNLLSWLHVQFPHQKLKIWEFKNEQNTKEYYLQTNSKLSTLFLYYALGHFKEGVSFKCPLGLDKMSEGEKAMFFKDVSFLFNNNQSGIIDYMEEETQNRLPPPPAYLSVYPRVSQVMLTINIDC